MAEYTETYRFKNSDPSLLEKLEGFLEENPFKILSQRNRRSNGMMILVENSSGLKSKGYHRAEISLRDKHPEVFWHQYTRWNFTPEITDKAEITKTFKFLQKAFDEIEITGESEEPRAFYLRGPNGFTHKSFEDYKYGKSINGTLENFSGYDYVDYKGRKILTLSLFGGITRDFEDII